MGLLRLPDDKLIILLPLCILKMSETDWNKPKFLKVLFTKGYNLSKSEMILHLQTKLLKYVLILDPKCSKMAYEVVHKMWKCANLSHIIIFFSPHN